MDQFQVVTSGGQAELGRALGGYINVVTKSGANVSHGVVYDYVRDDRLNAANALIGTPLPMNQSQYGASLGGPIRRDRTFYFINFEQRLLDQTGLVTILPQSANIINAKLANVGYQGPLVETGEYPNPVHTVNFLAKMDHQFSSRDLLSVVRLYDVDSSNSRGAGGLSAPSASAGWTTRSDAGRQQYDDLSARTVNECVRSLQRSPCAPSDP